MNMHHLPKPSRELIECLAAADYELPDSVRASIIARGDHVVPELIAILLDKKFLRENAPGGGHLPQHAAELLSELKAASAVEPMFYVLSKSDSMENLYNTLIFSLRDMGAMVLEPGLRAFEAARKTPQRVAIAEVLCGIEIRDERIFAALERVIEEDPVCGAIFFATYGDPEAMPHLSRALDKFEVVPRGGVFENREIVEIAGAIEELGGTLTDEQKAKQQRVEQLNKNVPRKLNTGGSLPGLSGSVSLFGLFDR